MTAHLPLFPLRHAAPVPAPSGLTDPMPICRDGAQAWLRHDWNVRGPCRRCGLPFPRVEVLT